MAVKNIGIGVIETRWFEATNTSVRPIFDLISEIWTRSPSNYHYEMFNDGTALKEIITRVSNKRGIRLIYLAGHGKQNGIRGSNGRLISRTHLRSMLRQLANEGCRKTKGLYIGSCEFLTDSTASFILKGSTAREHPMIWIAGFNKSVDWLKASALDLLFFNTWMRESDAGGESAHIRRVAERLMKDAPGLVKELGFNIYVRRPGNNGIESLVDEPMVD